MSCLTQHKTKEELSNWLMENASDNETTGFLDMLAGDIWDMMNAETELKEKTAEHLGMAETLHDAVVEENKKLKEENKKLQFDYDTRGDIVEGLKEKIKKLQEREYEMCQIANANGWDIYPTDSEEESEEE